MMTRARALADEALRRSVDSGEVPGVVALAASDNEMLFEGALGVRELGTQAPMTLDTLFWIASMTKPVTSVAALQLVERGLLALDEPLGDRVPELQARQVLTGFAADGTPTLRRPSREITLRQLMTHTAGFGYTIWNERLYRLQQLHGAPLVALETPLVNDPGERWEYGCNSEWLGAVVERTSGQSLQDYFRHHIFDPLGMRDTTFVPTNEQLARMAGRHQRHANGVLEPLPAAVAPTPSWFNGGGGLYSTGPDYVRFLRMLLGGGELDGQRVLSSATVLEMARNHLGDLNVWRLAAADVERSHDVEFFPGTVKKWGLAGMINSEQVPGGRSAGSWSWAGLNNTYFWVDPTRRLGGVVMTSLMPFCDPAVLELYAALERAVYAPL